MRAYRLCPPQLFRVLVASVLQALLWSGISAGQVEGRELGEPGRRAIEAEKRARDSIKINHPGWTDSQVQTLADRVQADFYQGPKAHLQVPPLDGAVVDLGLSAQSMDESTEKPTRRPPSRALAGVRELLNSESASGWGYLGYDWVPETSRLEEFRIVGLAGAPSERIEKFLLVDGSQFLVFGGSDLTQQHTVEIAYGENVSGQDLRRFYDVNNRFLRDVKVSPIAANGAPGFAGLGDSNALVVTGAKLANGREVLTIYSLANLAQTGFAHGQAYTDLHRSTSFDLGLISLPNETALGQPSRARRRTRTGLGSVLANRFADFKAGRVYYYGDNLSTVDIDALCRSHGKELILRSPSVDSSILATEWRQRQIDERTVSTEHLTFIDGLPQDRRAVQSMGQMVGDPSDWLDFHERVSRLLRGRGVDGVTTKEGFLHTLSHGDSDVIILMAHANGSQLYLNGKATSLKELQAMPARARRSARPRVAVLVSCDAGKPQEQRTGRRIFDWFSPDLPSLAQILIEKKFVDKVIAPDHKIQADESLTVIQRALEGAKTNDILPGWTSWAREQRRVRGPKG